MSDRMYAKIEIPKKFLKDPEVRKKIANQFWIEEDIEDYAEDVTENMISFLDDEARDGQLVYLEDFLEPKKRESGNMQETADIWFKPVREKRENHEY